MNRASALISIISISLCLTGCSDEEIGGPPQIRYGRDQCALCGMIIDSERCSAASIVRTPHGNEYKLFDEIGCQIEFEWRNSDISIDSRYVHDAETKAWLDSADVGVVVLVAESYRTPMASGIIAFSTRERALDQKTKTDGEIMIYATLRERHYRSLQEKYGNPRP